MFYKFNCRCYVALSLAIKILFCNSEIALRFRKQKKLDCASRAALLVVEKVLALCCTALLGKFFLCPSLATAAKRVRIAPETKKRLLCFARLLLSYVIRWILRRLKLSLLIFHSLVDKRSKSNLTTPCLVVTIGAGLQLKITSITLKQTKITVNSR